MGGGEWGGGGGGTARLHNACSSQGAHCAMPAHPLSAVIFHPHPPHLRCPQESVIRLYTRQILRGLEYLHQRGIMHRDIKGANILVDKCGQVKLADFGASKKIEDLATVSLGRGGGGSGRGVRSKLAAGTPRGSFMSRKGHATLVHPSAACTALCVHANTQVGSGCKSIRGTPYWMAPEVIKQTGHGRPADIWSVGCTVIEMATGKPPWSNYAAPVAAMFQIASSKDPPPIPDNISPEAKDFLLLCFNRWGCCVYACAELGGGGSGQGVWCGTPLPGDAWQGACTSLECAGAHTSKQDSRLRVWLYALQGTARACQCHPPAEAPLCGQHFA